MQGSMLDYNHVTVGTWTFWSEVYHKGAIDDFRLWNRSRTGDEIRRDMHRQLTGSETDLYSYWTFDSDSGGVVVDKTGRGNDLRAGGCVSCEPRFYCQPYSPIRPYEFSDADCIPSARDTSSRYFRTKPCFGGTVCFKGEERAETHPTIIPSGAPIGGHIFHPQASGGDIVEIHLNATDPDGDALTFSVESLPDVARLLEYRQGVLWIPITAAPFSLPPDYDRLRPARRERPGGGRPFTSLTYSAHDGLAPSDTATVAIHLNCPPGTFLNQTMRHCQDCPPGSYSTTDGSKTSCTLCGINEFQPDAKQKSCLEVHDRRVIRVYSRVV